MGDTRALSLEAATPESVNRALKQRKLEHERVGLTRDHALAAPEAKLRLMHQVRTQDRDILLEAGQHRLADPQGLYGFLIGAGQKMLVMRGGQAENTPQDRRENDMHRRYPFDLRQREA
jgi:hypothetical protein